MVGPRPFDTPYVSSYQHGGRPTAVDITVSLRDGEGTRRLRWCPPAAKDDGVVVPVRRRRRRSLVVSKSDGPSQKALPFPPGVQIMDISRTSEPVVSVAKRGAEPGSQKESSNGSSSCSAAHLSARPDTNTAPQECSCSRPGDDGHHKAEHDAVLSAAPSISLDASNEAREKETEGEIAVGPTIGVKELGSGLLDAHKEEEEASSTKQLVVVPSVAAAVLFLSPNRAGLSSPVKQVLPEASLEHRAPLDSSNSPSSKGNATAVENDDNPDAASEGAPKAIGGTQSGASACAVVSATTLPPSPPAAGGEKGAVPSSSTAFSASRGGATAAMRGAAADAHDADGTASVAAGEKGPGQHATEVAAAAAVAVEPRKLVETSGRARRAEEASPSPGTVPIPVLGKEVAKAAVNVAAEGGVGITVDGDKNEPCDAGGRTAAADSTAGTAGTERTLSKAAVNVTVEGGVTVYRDNNGPCGAGGPTAAAASIAGTEGNSRSTLGKRRLGRFRKRSLKAAVERFKRVKRTWCERLPRMPLAEASARAAADAVVQAERAVAAQRRETNEKQDFHSEAVQCLLLQSFVSSLEPPRNLVSAEERASRVLVEARGVEDALGARLAAAHAAAEQADVLVDEEAKERFALEYELNEAFYGQSTAKAWFDEFVVARRKKSCSDCCERVAKKVPLCEQHGEGGGCAGDNLEEQTGEADGGAKGLPCLVERVVEKIPLCQQQNEGGGCGGGNPAGKTDEAVGGAGKGLPCFVVDNKRKRKSTDDDTVTRAGRQGGAMDKAVPTSSPVVGGGGAAEATTTVAAAVEMTRLVGRHEADGADSDCGGEMKRRLAGSGEGTGEAAAKQ